MISKPHFYYLQKLELQRVVDQLDTHIDASVPKLLTMNNDSANWQIELANGNVCYMSNHFTAVDNEFYLVHVDALRFYQYWLSSSIVELDKHRSINCPVKRLMHKDYKYHWAVAGFSKGRSNPVPVAQVYAENNKGAPYLGFVNGVTRSLWLLANEATSFPVEVYGEKPAKNLFNVAGIGNNYIRYDELKLLRDSLPV